MDLIPNYREHLFVENSKLVDLAKLTARRLTDEEYSLVHQNTVISTHDAVVSYDGGVVLMERVGKPLKGFLWLPGGRMPRGVSTETSLPSIVKRECGLDITDLEFAGVERAFIPEDPFGHGKGSDTMGPIYFCRGEGQLLKDADGNHNHPLLIRPSEYDQIRINLHPFVQKYTDIAIKRIASGIGK